MQRSIDAALSETIRGLRVVLLDVDGVLTDGRLNYADGSGERSARHKAFHVRDGMGIDLLMRAGFEVGILTGRISPAVRQRAAELGLGFVKEGYYDKRRALAELMEERGLDPATVVYMGDDLLDLVVFDRVGLSAAPADAALAVRRRADFVADAPGGRGAVRALADWLIEARGQTAEVLEQLTAPDLRPPGARSKHGRPAAVDTRRETTGSAAAIFRDRLDDIRAAVDRLVAHGVCERSVERLVSLLDGDRLILVCGVGKSGHVARKLAATLCAVGRPACFVHGAEALHGDLGLAAGPCVGLLLSRSGRTPEVVQVARALKERGCPLAALTFDPNAPLARICDVALDLSPAGPAAVDERVPAASSTVMQAVGDALALTLFSLGGGSTDVLRRNHPGGDLSARLDRQGAD